jgi:hypothetical protein
MKKKTQIIISYGVACHAAYTWQTAAIPPNNPTSTSGKVEFSNDQ